MHKDPCSYGDYFHLGQLARVEMPLEGGSVFRDGAVVTDVADNNLALRLSRDQLPVGTLLHAETPLVIRVGRGGSGYSCRGVVIGQQPGEALRVALVDGVVAEEQREYFRCGADLPVILFNVTSGMSEESGAAGESTRLVNISGGGVRVDTAMAMAVGDKIYTTFNVPLPEPKGVLALAEVVHTSVIERAGTFVVSSGLKFVHISERDRDSIVGFVCNEEMRRIRLYRKRFYSLGK